MNRTCMILLHHWRRTRIWLIPPLLICALWTISNASDIWRSNSLDGAWNAMQTSVLGNVFILAVGALIWVVALGSGESSAAFPRYAQTLPVSDRRWALSYALYNLIVFSAFAGAITLFNSYAWNHAVAANEAGVFAAEKRYFAEQEKARAAASSAQTSPQLERPLTENAESTEEQKRRAEEQKRRAKEAAMGPFTGRTAKGPSIAGSPIHRPANTGASLSAYRFRRYQIWAAFERFRQPLLLISVAFFCQALLVALTLIQRVPIRVFAIAVALILAPATGIFLSHAGNFPNQPGPTRYLFAQFVWPFLLVLLGTIIMYLSSWRERHGETAFRRAAEVLTKQVGSPRLGFSSPARALAWYDWMTFGRYFIYGAVGLTIACTPFHLYEINRPEISGVPIMLVCGFAGVFLAYRLYYGDSKDNDAYLVTLPVSVERLSKLRLITITKFVATAAVIAILLEACIMLGVYPFSEPLGAPQASLWILLAPLCGWMLIWLTGPLFYPVIAGWLLAIVIAGFLKWFFLPQVPFEEIAGFTGGGIACVFALVATVWLVRAAKRRGLLFKWNKRLAVAAWLVATVITVPVFLEEFHGDATAAMFIIPLFLCLLPATPFIALPLAIDRYRHR